MNQNHTTKKSAAKTKSQKTSNVICMAEWKATHRPPEPECLQHQRVYIWSWRVDVGQ